MSPAGRNQLIGKWGEETAAAYLIEKGYEVVCRNYRTPFGEIDLIARKGDCITFIEVKTRTSAGFGLPEESVTARKRAHLVAAAQVYIEADGGSDAGWQIDVIAVRGRPRGGAIQIEHFENAVHG